MWPWKSLLLLLSLSFCRVKVRKWTGWYPKSFLTQTIFCASIKLPRGKVYLIYSQCILFIYGMSLSQVLPWSLTASQSHWDPKIPQTPYSKTILSIFSLPTLPFPAFTITGLGVISNSSFTFSSNQVLDLSTWVPWTLCILSSRLLPGSHHCHLHLPQCN